MVMGSDTVPSEDVLPNQLSNVTQELASHRNDLWRSNYHEASIYIEEGLNNDKFENHPRKRASKLVKQPTTSTINQQQQQQPSHPQQQQHMNNLDPMALPPQQDPQNNYQGTPLLTCIQSEKATILTPTIPAATYGNGEYAGASKDPTDAGPQRYDKTGGATFLLGGQYTTIETYILVHNRYFYQLDLAASIVLLMLAFVEPPAVDGYELNPAIHSAIEMFALGIIAIELLLKFRWMGPKRFFSHGRTVSKLLVLVAMNLEAIVILVRHSIHARYSRALRPIFLIDNHYCHGLRRAVRQIFQSLPPIIDMFTLAMFFMFVFSIFGFYLLASDNYYFSDMPKTVGNLLVLATTANLPDIMMPSYAASRWSAVYFVLFIIIHLFLFTNLTMAAVYEIFTRKEKEKFHKLLLHRRKACQKAFKLLVSRRQPDKIQYRQFMGLMRYLNQKCSMFDAYLIFKALDTDKSGSISLEEFYQIYDFINLKWKLIYPRFKWYDDYEWIPDWGRAILGMSERIIRHRFFEWSIDLLIIVQALMQFIEASALELPIPSLKLPLVTLNSNTTTTTVQETAGVGQQFQPLTNAANLLTPDKVSTAVFIGIFSVEAMVRCLALGLGEYWSQRWNRFDLMVLMISIAGLVSGSLGHQPFGWVLVLRVLRLMRAFKFKRRYKDMWQTLTYILLKRFVSMTCVVMTLYYFFAIIGMELLGDYDLRNCCKNTSIESQFKFDNSTQGAKYYLNDFGDIIASYLTMFSMSSNTFWLATMDAYAIVSETNWIRLFFGLYYLGSIIVMNIVIAFILESFLFHIHYRIKMGDKGDDSNLFTVSVTLSSFEVDFLRENLTSLKGTKKLDRIVSKLRSQKMNDKEEQLLRDADEGETMSLLRDSSSNKIHSTKHYHYHSSKHRAQQQYQDTELVDDLNLNTPTPEGVNHHHNNSGSSSNTNNKHPTSPTVAEGAVTKHTNKKHVNFNGAHQHNHHQQHQGGGFGEDFNRLSGESCHRPEWYLIYQAEQIRNKFSFTMKMYGDEVGAWLAEAEQADQDEMSRMISRNQIRAEHVAMARLARANLAEMQTTTFDDGLLEWSSRPRSWSTSGGAAGHARARLSIDNHHHHHHHHHHHPRQQRDSTSDTSPVKTAASKTTTTTRQSNK